ncbi:MAG: hypothetical protein ACR2K6_06170 [Solirubrobacterales bacterium]
MPEELAEPREEEERVDGPGRSGTFDVPFELDEIRRWTGHKLDDLEGATTGRVEGAFVDAEDGLPRWLVIRVGRLGRRSALPIHLVAAGFKRVWAAYPRSLIRSAPAVDPASGLTPEQEGELCDHFGIPEDDPRRGELAERPAESASSLPPA